MKITPDNFAGDPYGWATNQCGHVVIGVFMAVCVGMFIGGPELIAVCACLYFGWVEIWFQIRKEASAQRHKFFWDSIIDTAFVALGAALVIPMAGSWWGVAVGCLLGAGLAVGAWWRT